MQPLTDNIYKFSATFGLLIIFFSSYYTLVKIYDLKIEKSYIATEVMILDIDVNDLKRKMNELKDNVNILKDGNTDSIIYSENDYLNILKEYQNELVKFEKQNENLIGKKEVIDIKNGLMDIYKIILFFSLFLGTALCIFGFHAWYRIDRRIFDKK